jgi:hypothetical protein
VLDKPDEFRRQTVGNLGNPLFHELDSPEVGNQAFLDTPFEGSGV